MQRTGSFKIRGAYTRIARLDDAQRTNGVVAASAGNHAQGVALAASMLGTTATIFMPHGAALPKVQARSDGELFWIAANGIRMTGMPAFSPTHDEKEIWEMVAFIRHLPEITDEETARLKAEAGGEEEREEGEATAGAPGPEHTPPAAARPE